MYKWLERVINVRYRLYVISLVLLLVVIIFHKNATVLIDPNSLPPEAFLVYTDGDDGGASRILPNAPGQKRNRLSYELVDNNKHFIPYVGYSIVPDEFPNSFDLNSFDELTIRITPQFQQTCNILLYMHVEKDSPLDSSIQRVPLSYDLFLFPEDSIYTVKLKDFAIPGWWALENNVNSDIVDLRCLKRIHSMALHFEVQDKNYRNVIVFESLSFAIMKNELYLLWAGISTLILFLLSLARRTILQHQEILRQREKVAVPYETLDQISISVAELKKIVRYIGTNYPEQGLSIQDVSRECNLSSSRIQELLSEHFQEVTFKQYLNMLRVYEAKRLLLSSDMNISEICYNVGFSNVTHFNRTFKKMLATTPTELRKSTEEGNA